MIDKANLQWTGHVISMENTRIPKALLYGRLATGIPRQGNHNTYLNSDIDYTCLTELASERDNWRKAIKNGIHEAEEARINGLIAK